MDNAYSVPSRLIGEKVEVRLYMEHVEVWYAQREAERFARLRGRKKHTVHRSILAPISLGWSALRLRLGLGQLRLSVEFCGVAVE